MRNLVHLVLLLVLLGCSEPYNFDYTDSSIDVVDARVSTRKGRSYVRIYTIKENDKKIYFNGGVIAFNLVIFDQYLRPTGLSKIAYLELIHESNLLHEKYVIRLENGLLEGSIQIPSDAPTGNYQLVAYTQFMGNFDFEYLSQRLPIYIQNTSDVLSGKVVSEIRYDTLSKVNTNSDPSLSNDYRIDLRVEQSKINVEVSSSDRNSSDYYLVSEGFGSGIESYPDRYTNPSESTISSLYFKPTCPSKSESDDSIGVNDPNQYMLLESTVNRKLLEILEIPVGLRLIEDFVFINPHQMCDTIPLGNPRFPCVLPCCHIEEFWKVKFEIAIESMSKSAFDYWKKVQKLTKNDGLLFDTYPFPLTGNIICNDCANEVLGNFRAVSESIRKEDWGE